VARRTLPAMRSARVAPRRLPTFLLVAAAVTTGLGIAAAVDVYRSGGLAGWFARHGVPRPYLAQGRRVDIGGRSLYLDCRGRGRPTIVLEAGSGADSSSWSSVQDELALTTRTCAYDRAGRGRSDPAPRQTLREAVHDLRTLLAVAGEQPPFIAVGHSLGGAYGRAFAATETEVVGLVLVDSFNPDLEVAFVHPLLGSLRGEYAERLDGLRAHVAAVDGLDWTASELLLRQTTPLRIPVEALVAPRGEPRLDGRVNEAIRAAWQASLESLSPGRVAYTVAWGAAHDIQFDRPDLVIGAVGRLVEATRSGATLP
jgi:pimeloyl-ACP methyl ester carboxylesterase